MFTSRNTIKRFCLGGIDIVVKRYGHITSFNRLMYSTFRKSKAMRAYQHASQLRELGISTPEEIAMIETYKNGIWKSLPNPVYFWNSKYFCCFSKVTPLASAIWLTVTS